MDVVLQWRDAFSGHIFSHANITFTSSNYILETNIHIGEAQRLSLIAGDANDPKCLGFYSVKLRKVGGRITSSEGRAVLISVRTKAL